MRGGQFTATYFFLMDVVYPIGRGSVWGDREIKYSLRSVQKHLSGVDNIWVIGHLPDHVTNVRHIEFEDVCGNKEANICAKILRACDEPEISQDFLFMNDDHFLLSDFTASEFPYYYKGEIQAFLSKAPRRGAYIQAVVRTFYALRSKGKLTKYFDAHCPIVYNKDKFKQVMGGFDVDGKIGMVLKSLYCNILDIEGEQQIDCKINKLCMAEEILAYIKNKKFFSIGNKAINEQLEVVLKQLYPEPSRWEKEA